MGDCGRGIGCEPPEIEKPRVALQDGLMRAIRLAQLNHYGAFLATKEADPFLGLPFSLLLFFFGHVFIKSIHQSFEE